MEGERVLPRQAFDLVLPPDDRRAIGVMREERRSDLLAELRGRVVVDAHLALLEHDVALGVHDRVGEREAGHAIGLESHHRTEMLARDALEVGGIVVAK